MKPIIESIKPNPGSSFYIKEFKGNDLCRMSCWHIHPEYEIVYIKSGSGLRCIGNHISDYQDGELIMLGPNMPHQPFSNNETPDNEEIVVQFGHNFFIKHLINLPEAHAIKALLERSKQGITFSKHMKQKVANKLKALLDLSPLERLLHFINLLNELALSSEYKLLQADSMALEIKSNDYNRMNQIYQLVSEQYHRHISIQEMAQICGLSAPSFCRFFKKMTGKSFISFLIEYRILKVKELLSRKNDSIAAIMYACGFNEPAYFSRQFKKYTGYSPTNYKKLLQHNLVRYH